MEHTHAHADPIELGCASTDTLGREQGSIPEPRGLYFLGLTDE